MEIEWLIPWPVEPNLASAQGAERQIKSKTKDTISLVQLLSHVQLIVTPRTAACQASMSITNSLSFLNSFPLSQWCHPAISSSGIPFTCLQSFLASGSFPVSLFFASGSQSIGASASASVLPMNIKDWFPLGLMGLISCNPRNSLESYPPPQFKRINSSVLSPLYGPTFTSIHDHWKNHSFVYTDPCH